MKYILIMLAVVACMFSCGCCDNCKVREANGDSCCNTAAKRKCDCGCDACSKRSCKDKACCDKCTCHRKH